MSMSMSGDSTFSNSTMGIMMVPYLHFTGGDFLFFKSWHPSSHGAIAGACIGLVLLAVIERWIHGMRGLLEDAWRFRTITMMAGGHDQVKSIPGDKRGSTSSPTKEKGVSDSTTEHEVSSLVASVDGDVTPPRPHRMLPPFIASHDLPRGAIFAFQSLLAYALMLAVMTFQAAYFISVVIGLGIGEMTFGRYGHASAH